MALYEYTCPMHAGFLSTTRDDKVRCPHSDPPCIFYGVRRWSFSIAKSFTPHYSAALGQPISTPAQFQSELSRANDQAQQRGISQHMVPVDLMDKAALGVTNLGLDSTYDNLRRSGRDDDAKRLKKLMDE